MIGNESVLAVIPARAGSRRVPDKNLKSYQGKPLIQWAIESARACKYIDHLIVSSDSPKLLELARSYKCDALLRPDWLATDVAMNEGVLIHLLYTWKWAHWVVLLQPTSPLRTGADIDLALERAVQGNGCVSYNEYGKRNGAVYVTRSTELVSRATFAVESLDQFIEMPNTRSLDIDYAIDFER